MIRVLAIHGIATPRTDCYGARWAAYLGSDVEVVEGRWPSTGFITADLARLVGEPGLRERCVGDVLEAVDGRRFDVVVGHSAGQAVALEVARQRPDLARRVVTFGGPATHPLWGRALRKRGWLAPLNDHTPIHLFNDGDGVSASPLLGYRDAPGLTNVRIAVAGRDGYVGEHRDVVYLAHPHVALAIRGEA